MLKNNKIIIVCPNIPPNPGIGGRRWAKFSKYLDRADLDVCVVGFELKNRNGESNWTSDISNILTKQKVHFIPNHFPKVLGSPPNSFIGKLKYRLHLLRNKVLLKGNYYDSSAFWHKSLIPFLKKEIGTAPTTIIATGAPFTYLHSLISLKTIKKVKLVADFRDPWVDNKIGYGYKELSPTRFKYECKMELEVFQGFDLILNVNEEQHLYTEKIIGKSKKAKILPNGYDKEDLSGLNVVTEKNGKKIKLTFGGTLYSDAVYAFELLIKELDRLKKERFADYSKLEINFYGSVPVEILKHFNGTHSKILRHLGRVPLKTMYENIYNSHLVMIFLTKEMNFTRNTKFFESINLNKKILVFSNQGFLEKHVKENNIGYSMTEENISASFDQLFSDIEEQKNLSIPNDYDTNEYDIKNLTSKLFNLINNLDLED